MPTYKFGDSENIEWTPVPAGDYPFEVTGVDFGIQSGGKTNGSETMNLKLAVFADDTYQHKLGGWSELLIFHPSCEWKIDTFVKCSNLMVDGKPPTKDQEISFGERMVVGLRGWCTVAQRKFTRADGTEGTGNRVVTWLTNKPKLNGRSPIDDDDQLPF